MTLLSTDPVDWKIDRATWDLVIPLQRVSGSEGVAQRIAVKMRLIRGELFTDQLAGMPWFPGNGVDDNVVILGNPFNETLAKTEARKIIASIDGVATIDSIAATFDSKTRVMTIAWAVTTAFGDTIKDKLEQQL